MTAVPFSDVFRLSGRRSARSFTFLQIASIVTILTTIIGGGEVNEYFEGRYHTVMLVLAGILLAAQVVALQLAAAQRCRDFSWSGWCVFISLVPFVGAVFAIALCVIPGTTGENRYGPDPRDSG